MFKNKTLLLTGGTGSFGKNFLLNVQKKHKFIKKIIIFSRDELKQYHLNNLIDKNFRKKVRFFIGDIRDKDRLQRAMWDVDYIIHAAALKQVPAAEYDPFEYVKTNVIGAQNIIETSLNANVKKVIALSTDKAAAPINLYGATKLCSDKIFSAANNIIGKKNIAFSIVRYGNVFGSRGSVVPFFIDQKKKSMLPNITDPQMTRFNITLDKSIEMVEWTFANMVGGEIFVPKIPSYKILDMAQAIFGHKKYVTSGIRPGEKLHEEMITSSDARMTYDIGKYYAIINSSNSKLLKFYQKYKKFDQFSYNSFNNKKFLKIKDLKSLVNKFGKNEFF